MEDELVLGTSYTVDFLLNFLSENYRQNIFLISASGVDLNSLPRHKNFVIYEIQSALLHKFVDFNTYGKNEAKIYHIKPTS